MIEDAWGDYYINEQCKQCKNNDCKCIKKPIDKDEEKL